MCLNPNSNRSFPVAGRPGSSPSAGHSEASSCNPLMPVRVPFAFLAVSLFAGLCAASAQTVAINEFVASNGNVLADEDGDFEDWIEFYNYGESTVNLEGFGLSDDPDNLFRWIFPDVVIEPGEYLLVWASGKNRTDPAEALHANFSVSADGEPLLLVHPDDASVVDAVDPVALPRDHAYGRVPDGTGDWYYVAEPTPLAANDTQTYDAWMQPPEFSHEGGFHTSTVLLQLSTANPDATILYTLDGSEPDPDDIGGRTYRYQPFEDDDPRTATLETHVYDEPLSLASRARDPEWLTTIRITRDSHSDPSSPPFKGHVVRARAVRDGALPSNVVTHSYYITNQGEDRYDFLVLSITVPEDGFFSYDYGIYVPGIIHDEQHEGQAVWRRPANYHQRGREWEVPGHLEIFVPGDGRVLSQNVGYRMHGNASRSYFMKSIRVYSRRDYDDDGRMRIRFFDDLYDIYGRPVTNFNRLIIRQSGNDNPNSRYRDALMQAILRPMGLDDQRHLPVVHFINGEFWGHMNLRERVDRFHVEGRHLIDSDDVAMLTKGHDKGVYQGVMLKDGTEDDLQDYKDLIAYIEQNDLSDPDHYAHVTDQVDVENFILYNVGEIFVGNRDWPHNNNDFWRKRTPDRRPGAPASHDGRWRWVLVDLDFGFGMYGGSPSHDTLGWATRDESWGEDLARVGSTRLLRGLLENPEFRTRFANAFADHLNTSFQRSRVDALIDAFEDRIGPLRDGEHRERWPRMGSNHVNVFRTHARERPVYIRNRVAEFFGIGDAVPVTFDVSDPDRGALQVNTIRLDRDTPGLPDLDAPFPFEGRYYSGNPITVTALPNPGYRFAGWEEFPDHDNPTIEVAPEDGLSLTARFERGPEDMLLAYWNFNDTENMLQPTYSAGSAQIAVVPGPETGVTDAGGNGFEGANARWDDPAGRHLRINNPLGSTVELHVPTTDHTRPVLTYETRRSGQGAGRQLISYSVDGVEYEEFAEIILFDEDPIVHRFDFSDIEGAADNPEFRVRITFAQGEGEFEGGFEGNNRIDNLTLEGREIWVGSIFEGSEATENFGGGWKWNALGYLYDRHFPFVYSAATGNWLYIFGEDESSYYFWNYDAGEWAWTGSGQYPNYLVLSGEGAGEWAEF